MHRRSLSRGRLQQRSWQLETGNDEAFKLFLTRPPSIASLTSLTRRLLTRSPTSVWTGLRQARLTNTVMLGMIRAVSSRRNTDGMLRASQAAGRRPKRMALWPSFQMQKRGPSLLRLSLNEDPRTIDAARTNGHSSLVL